MHEGKHGILDDMEDMDDVFGKKKDNSDSSAEENKGHTHGSCCGHSHKKAGIFSRLFKRNR